MREFSPAREEKVPVMQQVTEIYGRENGWGCSSHHKKASIKASDSCAAAGPGSEGRRGEAYFVSASEGAELFLIEVLKLIISIDQSVRMEIYPRKPECIVIPQFLKFRSFPLVGNGPAFKIPYRPGVLVPYHHFTTLSYFL